ncbi:hypothetical protein G7B40_005505 [Aetokthonos hydrillicola Thurmond2011]|jgi:hypothetical protein|uniref:VWA containing CoxE family protein n=1 Tax=Aetokthonos hydrillicola Thurmond2011 TaxID=2712845 RepID=A0AAP5I6G1_9CYAN|nr:hypothetical protein [Aetokthonos hydrillicola]MBO3457299.1 hypothetical protein [Aetokthonos hydrillicola CCALA 1050]MBW4586645.1 hypothetical protein [Aetokthonos hydrillicola CCALA 1050]MDR9894028.1 hypothetical protein [Aetokthonos hydrillicola Thurmond2011]
MSVTHPILLDSLLLDIFEKLRDAGMALTLEQYDLLRQAVSQGYGLGGWEDLRRICKLLWVKPCPNYDASIFDRTFERYIQQHHAKMPVKPIPTPQTKTPSSKEPLQNLPQIPPRRRGVPSTQTTGEVQVPVAIQTSSTAKSFDNARDDFHFTPRDFSMHLQDVQIAWRLLRRSVRVEGDYELDIDATVYQIEREGIFTDVVMRPLRIRRTELLLLIDDNPAMIPFFPALQPFIQAIEEAWVTPARIYRFTSYPDEYLYDWHYPTKAEPLTNLLPKLHRNRTIALILSDAGAATTTYSRERIEGMSKFFTALSPCIRQLIWLNPLPQERWEYSSAWSIDAVLNGKMLTYEPASLVSVTRENQQESMISTWQLYQTEKI